MIWHRQQRSNTSIFIILWIWIIGEIFVKYLFIFLPPQNIKMHSTYIMLGSKSSPSKPHSSQKLNCLSTVNRSKFLSSLLLANVFITILSNKHSNNKEFQLAISIKENLFTFACQTIIQPFQLLLFIDINLNGSCFDSQSPEAIRVWSFSDSVLLITTPN